MLLEVKPASIGVNKCCWRLKSLYEEVLNCLTSTISFSIEEWRTNKLVLPVTPKLEEIKVFLGFVVKVKLSKLSPFKRIKLILGNYVSTSKPLFKSRYIA